MRASIALVLLCSLAAAAPAPAPTGPHPRLLLDDSLRASWKREARDPHSAVARAIDRCARGRAEPQAPDFARDSYMGFDWSANLSACLIAWVVTGDDADARTAIRYLGALLDDQEWIGDGRGGEQVVRRDTGYAIRSIPPYVALAYDWLHDHPAFTPALRARTIARLEQWLTWYERDGYHRRSPATNYHAGYTLAATFTAIALAGEGGERADELWTRVRDEIWGTDMARAVAPGGLLDGGDFPEGWQYAPLSIAEYALAYRAAAARGIAVDGISRWLAAVLVRTEHAMTANDTIAAIGDTEVPAPTIPVDPLTLTAILIGPAPAVAQQQAQGELARLHLSAASYPLYAALAEARGARAQPVARDRWPTAYFATGTQVLYARTSWRSDGVVLVARCASGSDSDHWHPDAGNLTLARGRDELLVDPSPYGSMSTLTGNAPAIVATELPESYRPSQGGWATRTHFSWALQTRSGVIAARCDYADSFRFEDHDSEIAFALRDVVLVPWGRGADATALVVDRAEVRYPQQSMYLRFRSPGMFRLAGSVARAAIGGSALTITRLVPASAGATVRPSPTGECYDAPHTCEASRFSTSEYRLELPGPELEAVHALDLSAGAPGTSIEAVGDRVYHLRRGGEDAYVALREASYSIPAAPARHVVVLAHPEAGASVAAVRAGDRCAITITAHGPAPTAHAPLVFATDASCAIVDDPRTGPAAPDLGGATGTLIPVGAAQPSPTVRRGSCDAGGGAAPVSLVAAAALLACRRRRARA